MSSGPDITRIARLIGDPARANMLSALMNGQALAAGELAHIGGVSAATASSHLNQLVEGGLLVAEKQGRHRYFRIADHDVAGLIEDLAGFAERAGHQRFQPGPKDPQMRRARVCYDHLAGEMGVELYDALCAAEAFTLTGGTIALSPHGRDLLAHNGLDLKLIDGQRRPACRTCLDWSVRRHHLAGSVGAALLEQFQAHNWLVRISGSRALRVTASGHAHWHSFLGSLSP